MCTLIISFVCLRELHLKCNWIYLHSCILNEYLYESKEIQLINLESCTLYWTFKIILSIVESAPMWFTITEIEAFHLKFEWKTSWKKQLGNVLWFTSNCYNSNNVTNDCKATHFGQHLHHEIILHHCVNFRWKGNSATTTTKNEWKPPNAVRIFVFLLYSWEFLLNWLQLLHASTKITHYSMTMNYKNLTLFTFTFRNIWLMFYSCSPYVLKTHSHKT